MSNVGSKRGKANLDPDGKKMTVFLEEVVPGEGSMPMFTNVGKCDQKEKYAAENVVNTILQSRSYPTDRFMTEAEVEEVVQKMQRSGY